MNIPNHFPVAALAAALLLAPGALHAQVPSSARVLDALLLPRLATSLGKQGVAESDIRSALDAMREHKVPPGDAADVLRDELNRVRDRKPTDNFGAFVTEQVREGARGRELAERIREAHGRRADAARRRAAEER